jgi:hypothetical protein
MHRRGSWQHVLGPVLLAWLCLLADGCGSGAAADDQIPLRIIIYPLDGTVRAAYRLGQPTTRFHFAEGLGAIRAKTWTLKTPGLTLDHDVISADNGSSFRDFTIAIKPDETAGDRVYPALFKVGPEGLALYTPYLAGDLATYQSFVQPKMPGNAVALAGAEREIGVFGMIGTDRYVYLGPSDYVHRGDATFVIPPDLPGWIGAATEARFDGVIKLYERRLGWALPVTPTVLMAYADTPGSSRYRGDVSAGYIMALRFRGHGWNERGADDGYDIVHLIAHESFHLWNGMLFNSRQMGDQPWLHEGSAEYAALLALRTLGELSDDEFRDDLEGRINRCHADLGDEPLWTAGGRLGNAAYDCGVLVQWIADVATRRRFGRGRDFFSLWHDLFAAAATRHNVYGVEEFEQAVPPEALPAIQLILRERGAERWDALPARLKALGIDLTPPSEVATDDALRHRALLHLLIQACGADRHGFVTEPGFLQLNTGSNCGTLAGDPAIASAEGHDLFRDMPGAFAAMVKKCGSTAPVILGGETAGENFLVACPKPLPADPRYILGATGIP